MMWLEPLAAPVALAALAHAWIIPELYAFRGRAWCGRRRAGPRGRTVRAGLLGDLLGNRRARASAPPTGLGARAGAARYLG